VARSAGGVHPVIGLWPIGVAGKLEAALDQGQRKASAWAEQQGAVEVFFPPTQLGSREIDPFFNINRPEDLAEANASLTAV
jgi:molybdopterin-guanine dinucleotide biosynthesis protein A